MKDRPVDSRTLIAEDPSPEVIDKGTEEDPAFAKRATDLQALREAVVDAANVGGGLWLSYLFIFFYLAIAAGGVTHRDLLFENQVKLPFLNIDLPLIGFFVLGPPLFVIVHAYTLLHFTLLAGKVRDFDAALRQQVGDLEPKRFCVANCRSARSSHWQDRLVAAANHLDQPHCRSNFVVGLFPVPIPALSQRDHFLVAAVHRRRGHRPALGLMAVGRFPPRQSGGLPRSEFCASATGVYYRNFPR